MGIRYDRDAGRATNGPLLFFSDPSSEGGFAEEIRGAIISGLSFYAYHTPYSSMISYGSSEGYVEGIGVPGFAIGMFDPSKPYITIPYRDGKRDGTNVSLYHMPVESTSEENYRKEVETIKTDLQKFPSGKVVAARAIVKTERTDIAEKFYELCRKFPDAYVFCFSTPATGCWIGASPELLLESRNGQLSTMALAGTRKAGTDGSWDAKNIEEQEIVVNYIFDVFTKQGFNPETEETYTKISGNIEHICTPIRADISENTNFIPEEFLRTLSPTPALCGHPKEFAFNEIKRLEGFDRGCYGGFCGPFHSVNDFTFNVAIRCASIAEKRSCIYVGGGITLQSDVSAEWQETLMKAINTGLL